MEVLNSATLYEAFRMCEESPGTNIGIFCCTRRSAENLIEAFWDEIKSGGLPGWEMGRSADIISCANTAILRTRIKPEPSYIEIFVPHCCDVDGRTFQRIMYEDGMPDQLIQELARIELPQLHDTAEEDDGAELDEFLNSFKIV